jgi:hypothetical protein
VEKYVGSVVVGLLSTVIISGCATNQFQPSHSTTKTPVKTVISSPAPLPSNTWHFVGNDMFLLQGKVMGIDVVGQSLKLRIDDITPNGPLRKPTPELPYPIGSTVTIRFKQPFPTKGPLKPSIGESVQLWVGQYTAGTNHQPFLGSDTTHSFYYEKNGKFYNADGEQPIVLT